MKTILEKVKASVPSNVKISHISFLSLSSKMWKGSPVYGWKMRQCCNSEVVWGGRRPCGYTAITQNLSVMRANSILL